MVTLISLSAYEAAHAPSRYTKDAHWEATTPRFTPSAAVPVVAAHTAAALFCAEFTGIGLNPARSLAIAAVSGAWSYHWVYWVGPALGGLLAAFTHSTQATRTRTPSRRPITRLSFLGILPGLRISRRPWHHLVESPTSLQNLHQHKCIL
nr:probable aquaporin TIP4-1 [Penaeus vannamei]